MFRPNAKFTDLVPRLEALHEGAPPAELLILYVEPDRLHNKAAGAVQQAKYARDLLDHGTELADEWEARSRMGPDTTATDSEAESQDDMDGALHELVAEEYGKLAEEARDEMAEHWDQYPELTKEAAIGRLVLREQLRLGLRRRLIHALAGAAIAAGVIVPPLYAGISYVNEQRAPDHPTGGQELTEGQDIALAVGGGSAAIAVGMISFSTHGRKAGDRVARKKMRKKYGRPKFEEL